MKLNRIFCQLLARFNKRDQVAAFTILSGQIYLMPRGRFSCTTFINHRTFHGDKKAYYWSDIVFQRKGPNLLKNCIAHRHTDLLLQRTLDVSDRITVRQETVQELLEKGLISNSNSVHEAFLWLLENEPEQVQKIDNVFRYFLPVGFRHFMPVLSQESNTEDSPVSIVVNYKDKPELMKRFLGSLVKQKTKRNIELVLINNQSTDRAATQIKKDCDKILDSRFTVQHLNYSLPYNHSAQTNLGVRESKNEIVFIANNDIRLISKNAIDELAKWSQMPNVATVGPLVVGNKGRLVAAGMELYSANNVDGKIGIRECETGYYAFLQREVIGNPFAFCAVKKSVWFKMKGLEEDAYPSQYNDADFCIRAKDAGFKHYYLGNIEIFHEPGCSEARTMDQMMNLHSAFCSAHKSLKNYTHFVMDIRRFSLKEEPRMLLRATNNVICYIFRLREESVIGMVRIVFLSIISKFVKKSAKSKFS